MKRYNNLFEQIASFENLSEAVKKTMKCKKNKPTVREFYFNFENEIIKLREEILSGKYEVSAYHFFKIFEPKERKISAAAIRDRVVYHAVCNIIEPIIDKIFIFDSYACRKGKGLHSAITRAQSFCRKNKYYLKMDISKYFDSIDHLTLKKLLRTKFKDERLLNLIDKITDSYKSEKISENKCGISIGNLTSQLFANFYLNTFDHWIKEEKRIAGYIRYMDDIVIFADDIEELKTLKIEIIEYLQNKLLLTVKEKGMSINSSSYGLPFLGFVIYPRNIRVKYENILRFNKKSIMRAKQYQTGLISEKKYELSMRGMIGFLKVGNTYNFRCNFFKKNKSVFEN